MRDHLHGYIQTHKYIHTFPKAHRHRHKHTQGERKRLEFSRDVEDASGQNPAMPREPGKATQTEEVLDFVEE